MTASRPLAAGVAACRAASGKRPVLLASQVLGVSAAPPPAADETEDAE